VPHIPQERGFPLHDASVESAPPPLEANTESFFVRRFDPHLGQGVPFHLLERTRISLSTPHFPQ
jgi:hypothetical protein